MKRPRRVTRVGVAIAATLVLALGSGAWAFKAHQASQDRAGEAVEAAKAHDELQELLADIRERRRSEPEKLDAVQKNAIKEGDAFCRKERPLSILDNRDVYKRVTKKCPEVIPEVEKAEAGNVIQLPDDETGDDSGFIGSDPYCFSRLDVALQGNGPDSPYFDYPDEDIARSEAEYRANCDAYDAAH